MSIITYKRFTIVLGVSFLILLFVSCGLFWNYTWLTIHVAFASEQTDIFEEMRTRALKTDVAEAAGCLQYTVFYYPSGTKQETGSRLDRIVERDRKNTVREIISYLRTKTDNDLGENPEAWIQKYAIK
jgi:hypothetical protein